MTSQRNVMKLLLADAEKFPAKTVPLSDGTIGLGISVRQHGLITAEVLRCLLDLIRFPLKEKILPKELVVLGAGHDIGKENPLFLGKLIRNSDERNVDRHWVELSETPPGLTEEPHARASASILAHLGAPDVCADVVECHHGRSGGHRASVVSPVLGGRDWIEARETLLRKVMKQLDCDTFPALWRENRAARRLQKDVWAGLVTISDWIASRQEAPVPEGEEKLVAGRLFREAGFHAPVLRQGADFKSVFGFAPRPEQEAFMGLYRGPGVYVLEAPTGCGKTEAALGLAFKAIEARDAGGIYFALPTQLTSNRIHERLEAALKVFLKSDSEVQLIHSGARLRDMKLGKEGAPGESFFSGNKQALIASFGAGTVDQALLSLLKTNRFFRLRMAGLVGKVVILDEIHSYDAYTSTLVAQLISNIEALGGTVIVLSATLTDAARSKLLDLDKEVVSDKPVLITSRVGGDVRTHGLTEGDDSRKSVRIRLEEGEQAEEACIAAVLTRVRRGEQVLWIENTVDAAQRIYRRFRQEEVECGLLHSRFRGVDREEAENCWIDVYGRNGEDKRQDGGHVLIGTQVLEQSLDIDADFLVTRLAPMDLLIQRMGRLWRHSGSWRPRVCSEPEVAVIAAPEAEYEPDEKTPVRSQFGKSGFVYAPYVLLKTLETLRMRLDGENALNLPGDVRNLLERAYAEQEEVEGSEAACMKMEFRDYCRQLEDAACGAQVHVGNDSQEDEASTRWISYESHPVVIVLEEELETAPADRTEMAIWLESRLVKSSWNLKGASLSEEKQIPDKMKKFIERSKRFSGIPAFILRNGRLEDAQGKVLMEWMYDRTEGLYRVDKNCPNEMEVQ